MSDIYLGLMIMGIISMGLFVLGWNISKYSSARVTTFLTFLNVMFIFLFAFMLQDNLLMAKLLPFSNLIVLGNWLPPSVALLLGLAWHHIPTLTYRKVAVFIPLYCFYIFKTYEPLFTPPLRYDVKWVDGVCLQTTDASCTPASAATFLRSHGIFATEEEMARLCFTQTKGTTMHGLYRGLKLKAKGTDLKIEVIPNGIENLKNSPSPVIMSVKLERDSIYTPKYNQLGWIPGVPHTVVFMQFSRHNRVLMGDPSIGLEEWNDVDLYILWKGPAMRLTPTDNTQVMVKKDS